MNVLKKESKIANTIFFYITCKKCKIYHEVCMYNIHGILMFTLFLQNVYRKPNDGPLRQKHYM